MSRKVAKLKNNLPEIVRQYLEANQPMSQTKLAQLAGINPSTLSNMLRGKHRRIDLDTAEKLQDVIGFEINELIVRVEE